MFDLFLQMHEPQGGGQFTALYSATEYMDLPYVVQEGFAVIRDAAPRIAALKRDMEM